MIIRITVSGPVSESGICSHDGLPSFMTAGHNCCEQHYSEICTSKESEASSRPSSYSFPRWNTNVCVALSQRVASVGIGGLASLMTAGCNGC